MQSQFQHDLYFEIPNLHYLIHIFKDRDSNIQLLPLRVQLKAMVYNIQKEIE